LDLSRGVSLLEVPTGPVSRAQGDMHLYGNPHYWLQPNNVRVMVQTIARKLSEMDPANDKAYGAAMSDFVDRLDAKIREWKAKLAPFRGKELVGYHREYVYLADFAGLRMEQYLEPKPGIPPTPQHLQEIERYITERKVQAIVQSSYFPREAALAVARKTGAQPVILCQNVRELPACSDYIAMMDYNVNQLVKALQ
jgi:zinc/manganese transport system substrate-binding protein